MADTLLFSQTQTENQDYLAKLVVARTVLLRNGYEPIPVLAHEKRPCITGWTRGEITDERILYLTCKYKDHLSTGLRTGHQAAIDIDLWNADHAETIRVLVETTLGETTLRRRGSKGFMLAYHNPGDVLGKLIIKNAETKKTLVETFGQGNQYVAYGVHPLTQKPYEWLVEGREPFLVPLWELPEVNKQQLLDLQVILVERLKLLGYPVAEHELKLYDTPLSAGRIEDAGNVTGLFLQLIPHVPPTHSGWRNFSCPVCQCKDGRAGFMVTSSGGFKFFCFHTGCEYFDSTGWEPGGFVGPRVRTLYSALGGNADELPVIKPRRHTMKGIVSLKEMLDDLRSHGEGAS
jgi:hypothetical protein